MKKFFNSVSDRTTRDLDRVRDSGLTRLQEAVDDDDRKRLVALLKRGASINETGLCGQTPLHRAIALDRYGCALSLIEHGADVNFPDHNGHTPLHFAVLQGDVLLVNRLLEHGADPLARDHEGRTPMHLIPQHRDEMAGLLQRHGGDVNMRDNQGRTPLHFHLRHDRVAQALLALGADPNIAGDMPSPFAVALSVPLVGSNPAVLAAMLARGADLDTPATNGERLLHLAARLGQRALLFSALGRADATLRDNDGNTAMHALMKLPQPELARALLARAPELAATPNNAGVTPLQLLLEDLASTPERGAETHLSTLLHMAQILIEGGADPSTQNSQGATLLHEAVRRRQLGLVDFLAAHKANFNARDKQGLAPLQHAINAKNVEFTDRLLDHGADPDLTDERGWTVLDRLAERKDRESPIVQRLIVAGGQYVKQLPLYPDLMRPRDKTPPRGKALPAAPAANDSEPPVIRITPRGNGTQKGGLKKPPFN